MSREWSQYGQRVCMFWKFLQFSLYNYGNFVSKNLCDKVSKIKNLKWLLRRNFCCLHPGVLHFFCRHCFHGEFRKTPLKKSKNSHYLAANLNLPPPQGASPIQEDRFEPTNFNWGPRISFISILTCHEKVNHLKQLVIRFVQKLTV